MINCEPLQIVDPAVTNYLLVIKQLFGYISTLYLQTH